MPTFVQMAPEEFKSREKGPGKHAYLPEYQDYLNSIPLNGGGVLNLEEGEKKATVKNRLKYTARTLGKSVRILRAQDNSVKFQIVAVANGDSKGSDDEAEVADAA